MKRILYILLPAFLLILFCPFTAYASQVYTEGYFKYTVEDDSVSICEYYGKESEVTVPSMIAGNPVSTIAKGAFSDNSYVEKVNLPDTIMTIEEGAFAIGISIVYDSNTEEPVESGASNPPDLEEPDDPSDNVGNSNNGTNAGNNESTGNNENTGNTTVDGENIGIEEVEVTLDETDTHISTGITIPNNGKTVTVNDKNQLVSMDSDGNVTILDDTQKYTLTENEDGAVKITNETGEEVSIDESGNLIIPSVQSEESDKTANEKTSVKTIVIVVIIVIIAAIITIGICLSKQKKKTQF